MNGILYGIGVGVGDPEMLTLKAVRILGGSDLICVSNTDKEKSRAFKIIEKAIPEIRDKEILSFDVEMTRDREYLDRCYAEIYEEIKTGLLSGKTVSYITIGDPTVYSSFLSIAGLAQKDGMNVRMINGVSSFCACAARLGISLCEGDGSLHIIPASEYIRMKRPYPGTNVIMKCGSQMSGIKKQLIRLEKESLENGQKISVYGAAECGTDEEVLYSGAEQLPENGKYMMTVIVKTEHGNIRRDQ